MIWIALVSHEILVYLNFSQSIITENHRLLFSAPISYFATLKTIKLEQTLQNEML